MQEVIAFLACVGCTTIPNQGFPAQKCQEMQEIAPNERFLNKKCSKLVQLSEQLNSTPSRLVRTLKNAFA